MLGVFRVGGFSVALCGRVEVRVADVKRKGEERSGGSIDQLRSQSKEGVVATLHFPTPISICTCPEATAGMTASALFCYSRRVRYPRPCITLLLLDSTHYECLVLTSNHMSSFFSMCSKQTIPSDITWPLTGLELVMWWYHRLWSIENMPVPLRDLKESRATPVESHRIPSTHGLVPSALVY